jgi:hypothetical protein
MGSADGTTGIGPSKMCQGAVSATGYPTEEVGHPVLQQAPRSFERRLARPREAQEIGASSMRVGGLINEYQRRAA